MNFFRKLFVHMLGLEEPNPQQIKAEETLSHLQRAAALPSQPASAPPEIVAPPTDPQPQPAPEIPAAPTPPHPQGAPRMNVFLTFFSYAMALLPTITLGIQTAVGDSVAGKTKSDIAYDELSVALHGAASVLPAGSTNAALANEAGAVAATGINLTTTIAGVLSHLRAAKAVTTVVNFNKATGAHQDATAAFNASATPAPALAPAATPAAVTAS